MENPREGGGGITWTRKVKIILYMNVLIIYSIFDLFVSFFKCLLCFGRSDVSDRRNSCCSQTLVDLRDSLIQEISRHWENLAKKD